MCASHTAKCCTIFWQDIIISNMSLLSDGVMPKELHVSLFKQFVVNGIVSGIRWYPVICEHFRDDALMCKQHCYLCLMFHFSGLFFWIRSVMPCHCGLCNVWAGALKADHFKHILFTAFHLVESDGQASRYFKWITNVKWIWIDVAFYTRIIVFDSYLWMPGRERWRTEELRLKSIIRKGCENVDREFWISVFKLMN